MSRIGRLFSAAEKSYAALRFHSPVRCSGLLQHGNRFVAEARVIVLVAEVPGGVLRSQQVEAVLAAIEQVVQHQGLTNVLHFQRCQMRQPVAAFFGFDRRQPRAVVDVKVQQQKIRDISPLLNEALQNIRTQLLVDNTSPLLLSCRSLIEDSIRIYNYRNGYLSNRQKDNSFNFDKIVKYFKQNIQDQNVRCSTSITHDFNIGRTTTTWNLGPSGYVKSYLNSYRYLQAYESTGHPIGLTHLTINDADFQYIISNYIQYNKYALLLLVRLNNTNIVKKCILRETLVDLSTEYANKIFDTYYSYIITGIEAKTSPLYIRTGNVLLPLFSRLATKLSSDRIIKFLNLYITNLILRIQ